MTDWAAFAGLVGAVLVVVLLLARASEGVVTDGSTDGPGDPHRGTGPSTDGPDTTPDPPDGDGSGPETGADGTRDGSDPGTGTAPSTGAVLANVAVSQGVLGLVVVAGARYAAVPPGALGLPGVDPGAIAVGAALGVALYLANELGAAAADRAGIGHDERLRALLAPDSTVGWVALLGVALPVVAGFEELLFRAALVGAIPAGFGVSPLAMAVLSSAAFGLGHGAQGAAGVAVTGLLGLALAAAFLYTGSLPAVILAHYLVNALEFLVHEALGIDWTPTG